MDSRKQAKPVALEVLFAQLNSPLVGHPEAHKPLPSLSSPSFLPSPQDPSWSRGGTPRDPRPSCSEPHWRHRFSRRKGQNPGPERHSVLAAIHKTMIHSPTGSFVGGVGRDGSTGATAHMEASRDQESERRVVFPRSEAEKNEGQKSVGETEAQPLTHWVCLVFFFARWRIKQQASIPFPAPGFKMQQSRPRPGCCCSNGGQHLSRRTSPVSLCPEKSPRFSVEGLSSREPSKEERRHAGPPQSLRPPA